MTLLLLGAGPAGSTAAKFLSEKGVKLLLIDKKKFPRDKPCGGTIPARILKRFKYIEEKDLIESYAYGAYLHLSSLDGKLFLNRKPGSEKGFTNVSFDYYFSNEGGTFSLKFLGNIQWGGIE